MTSLHDFTVRTLGGAEQSLREHEGKTLLIVNVASQCGLTPQYTNLQKLHDTYSARGFAVLGFPCNQFGKQEPGSEAEIKQFCETRYSVTFPMFAKVEVNGPGAHPLYQFLKSQPTTPEGPGEIAWNFGKFLVGPDGRVLARFAPPTDPLAKEIVLAIEKSLGS
ncbi:MAG: glutathione peroxidase [Sandaracinaceae bacterium]|nr:glutathione peroxidase [Sandaracinaceae bacterium]